MTAYAYYPGCSLSGLGKPYDESLRAVFGHLGIGLEEIPDWNCCGATSYMSISEDKAVALAARNLAIAEKRGAEVVAPCAACFLVLTKAQHMMTEYPALAAKVHKGLAAAGLTYEGRAVVRHPLDVLVNVVGLDAIRAKVTHPLAGYRVAPYYGCQVVRPYGTFDDPLRPQTLDRLMAAVGAHVVDYPLKAHCCGATSYMSISEDKAVALAARNLAIAEKRGAEVVAPCAACFLVLTKAQHMMTEYPALAAKVHKGLAAAGLTYEGRAVVRHPLDVLVNVVGLDAIREKVTHPLAGYRVAPYYGCQVVRPYGTFDDPLRPQTLDRLMAAVGAHVVDYPLKAHCCGGSLMGTMENIGVRLNFLLLKEAKARTANVLATVCPLCQYNLEAYQGRMRRDFHEDVSLPVVYFTQLLGVAFGLAPAALGLHRNFVTAEPLPAMA